MALNKTLNQLFGYSGGTTCPKTQEIITANLPGATGDTVVDIYQWGEWHRVAGNEHIRAYLVGQFKAFEVDYPVAGGNFITWALGLLTGAELSPKHTERMAMIDADQVGINQKCRWLRQMLLEYTDKTEGDLLTKCQELLGIIP